MKPGDTIKYRTISGHVKEATVMEVYPEGDVMAAVDGYPHPISWNRIVG